MSVTKMEVGRHVIGGLGSKSGGADCEGCVKTGLV